MVQRQAEEEEEEIIQTKEASGCAPEVGPGIESRINEIKCGGRPLPASVRVFFEPRFGYNFSQVRVHTDLRAAESARAINARAFTRGQDVVFGAGQYSPESNEGKSLLAHELTHVLQQTKAREIQTDLRRKPDRDIIKDYKNTFQMPDPDIINFGQFYCTNKLKEIIYQHITNVINSSPSSQVKKNLVKSNFDSLLSDAYFGRVTEFQNKQKSLDTNLRNHTSFDLGNDAKRKLLRLVGSFYRIAKLKAAGLWIYVKAWEQIKKGNRPNFISLCNKKETGFSLTCLLAVSISEAVFCGGTAQRVKELFYKRKGLKLKGISLSLRGNTEIKKNIPKLKNFLNTNAITYARVLSGNVTQPNHSIVIIGYEGDKFLFWDPDVAASSLQVNGIDENGFGWLMHNETIGFLKSSNNKYRVLSTQ